MSSGRLAIHKNQRYSQRRGMGGFTLIELLVVIAIIALLAAILFPVFARARENARKSSCLNNVKQLGIGLAQYTQDYDEQFILGGWSGSVSATNPCRWYAMLAPYVKSTQVYVCPSANRFAPTAGYINNAGGYGLNQNIIGYNGPSKALSDIPNVVGTSVLVDTAQLNTGLSIGTDPVQWVNQQSGPSDWQWTPPGNWNSTGTRYSVGTCSSADNCRRPVPRHLEGMNVYFLDGHAKWYTQQAFLGPMPDGWPYGDPRNTWDDK